ncbi:MAG: hypothetical protein AAGD00_09655 [Planctomycetota bacterium]
MNDGETGGPRPRRRGVLVRVTSNYARLLINISVGVAFVPVLLKAVGQEGFGLILLMGSAAGIGLIFEEVVRGSMIRELGSAWHEPGRERFPRVNAAATVLAMLLALFALLVFALMQFALPLLSIPEELMAAARWYLALEGLRAAIAVGVSPQFNFFMIDERFVSYNILRVLQRQSLLIAALAVLFASRPSPAEGVVLYGIVNLGVTALLKTGAVGAAFALIPDMRPRLALFERGEMIAFVRLARWRLVTNLAQTMHLKLDQVLMNVFFGVVANAWFGIAMQLASYVRMIAVGITDGLEAVATRTSAQGNDVRSLLTLSTRLSAGVSVPACVGVAVLAPALIDLWVGKRLDDPSDTTIVAWIARALLAGVLIRAITDAWIQVMYGAGHIRRYALHMLTGGVANVALASILASSLQTPLAYYGPALAFSIALLVFHLLIIGRVCARVIGVSYAALLRPIGPGVLATLIATPMLFVIRPSGAWTLLDLALCAGSYGVAYAIAGAFLVIPKTLRNRLLSKVRGRGGSGGNAAAVED